MKRILQFFIFMLVASCAIESMPIGGEKDTQPPQVTLSKPVNYSVNFNQSEVVLGFDEFVQLKNFDQQFSVSPPLTQKAAYTLQGKKLVLDIHDSLIPNTTYTITFGNAIQDVTENNPQTEFKYVFSTGTYLDSSRVSGKAINAFTGNPEKGLIAALYPVSQNDSLAYQQKPNYYSITQTDGSFVIENVKPKSYRLFVFEDQNFDFNISSLKEKKGFLNFETNAQLDTQYVVNVFREDADFKTLGVQYKTYGKVEVYCSRPVYDFNQITLNNYSGPKIITTDLNQDTLFYWINPENLDSLTLFVDHQVPTTIKDTFALDLSKVKKEGFTIKSKTEFIKPNQRATLTSSQPLKSINVDSIIFVKNQDTTAFPAYKIDTNGTDLVLLDSINFEDQILIYALPGAFTSWYDSSKDSLTLGFKTKLDKDYALLKLTVNYNNILPGIVELLNEKGATELSQPIYKPTTFNIPYLDPGKYSMRLTIDRNKDGKWTSGNFLEKKQPEKIIHYQNAIDLRANWEIEIIFNVDPN